MELNLQGRSQLFSRQFPSPIGVTLRMVPRERIELSWFLGRLILSQVRLRSATGG